MGPLDITPALQHLDLLPINLQLKFPEAALLYKIMTNQALPYSCNKFKKREDDTTRNSDNLEILKVEMVCWILYFLHLRFVNLACLPEAVPAPVDGQKCWITGFGRLSSGGPSPNVLMQASVPIVSRARCDKAYPGNIHDSMICAGLNQGGIDSCQGDSGGPMVCISGGRYYLQGATSWGYGCAVAGKFGVYAKVKYLLSWINGKIGGR